MGCTAREVTLVRNDVRLPPIQGAALKDNEEHSQDLVDPAELSKWPYDVGRLKEVDHRAIIELREPWTDPDFPPDATALFIDGKQHQDAAKLEKRKVWNEYTWMRASEYFESAGQSYHLFQTIEPEDVKQGNLNNCHLLATLSGLAERDVDQDLSGTNPGKTVRDLFVTKRVNKAGCYALRLIVNGEEKVVVVDDHFPMKKNK